MRLRSVESLAGDQAQSTFGHIEFDAAILEPFGNVPQLNLDDPLDLGDAQRPEHDDVVQPVDELGAEEPAHCVQHLLLHLLELDRVHERVVRIEL